jgi:hypothetical protein
MTGTGKKASTYEPWQRSRGLVTTTNKKGNIPLNNKSFSRLYSWLPLQNQWSLAKPYHYGVIHQKNYPNNYTKWKIMLRKLSGYHHIKVFIWYSLWNYYTSLYLHEETNVFGRNASLIIFRMANSRMEQFYRNLFYRKWKIDAFSTFLLSNF